MSDWIEVCRVEDIPRMGARVARTGDGDIAVFRTAKDQIFALRDRCPHKNGPLSQGIVHGARVTCPLHNLVMELADGQATPPDEGSVPCYPVRIEEGKVLLLLPGN